MAVLAWQCQLNASFTHRSAQSIRRPPDIAKPNQLSTTILSKKDGPMLRFIMSAILLLASLNSNAANRFLLLTDSMFTQAYGNVRPSKLAPNIINNNISGILSVMGSPGLTVAPQGGYAGAVDLLPAIESWKGRFGAVGVFLHVSTNDHGLDVPLSAYKASLSALVSGVKEMGLGVICIRPFAKITQNQINAAGYKLSDYQAAMSEVCSQHGAPTLTFATVGADFVDGIHLSEAGHAKFADWLIGVGKYLGAWSRARATIKTRLAAK